MAVGALTLCVPIVVQMLFSVRMVANVRDLTARNLTLRSILLNGVDLNA